MFLTTRQFGFAICVQGQTRTRNEDKPDPCEVKNNEGEKWRMHK